jgi:4-hydroxy-tetrahydrodipicolinate reductase
MGQDIKVAIAGINGKMGRASARAILADDELKLAGAFGKSGAPYVGLDVGELASTLKTGILVSNGITDVFSGAAPDVLLDFTRAEAAFDHARLALERGVRPVIGTSGLGEKEIQTLSELATKHKVGGMVVPNFSVGAVLMVEFARQAAAMYANVEVVEMHHTRKLDAPSGTAMYTLKKLKSAGGPFNQKEVEDKELLAGARGAQSDSGVRVHSLRLPGLISHQEVIFGANGELLTIRHDSFNTDCFIKGILMALKAVTKMNNLVVGLENLLVSSTQ